MGSSFAPLLVNPFMGHHEKIWLNNYLLLKFYSMDVTLTTPFLSFFAGLSRLRVTIEDINYCNCIAIRHMDIAMLSRSFQECHIYLMPYTLRNI